MLPSLTNEILPMGMSHRWRIESIQRVYYHLRRVKTTQWLCVIVLERNLSIIRWGELHVEYLDQCYPVDLLPLILRRGWKETWTVWFYCKCNTSYENNNSVLGIQGLYSLNGRTFYRKISWSLEGAIFGIILFQSLWNLTGTSAAALPRWLSNFSAIRSF